jgi:hypothetical protein
MTIVTGASPRTLGIDYEAAWDRSLDGPARNTGNGNPAGTCLTGMPPTGFTTNMNKTSCEETIDLDQTRLNLNRSRSNQAQSESTSIRPGLNLNPDSI